MKGIGLTLRIIFESATGESWHRESITRAQQGLCLLGFIIFLAAASLLQNTDWVCKILWLHPTPSSSKLCFLSCRSDITSKSLLFKRNKYTSWQILYSELKKRTSTEYIISPMFLPFTGLLVPFWPAWHANVWKSRSCLLQRKTTIKIKSFSYL